MTQETLEAPSVALRATASAKKAIPAWATLGLPRPNLPVGGSRCECVACGEFFSNDTNFRRHRHNGQCAEPSTRRLVLNPRGIWTRPGKNESS